jgi:hypothetical protein
LAAHERPLAEVEGRGDEYAGFYGARPSTPAADVAFVTQSEGRLGSGRLKQQAVGPPVEVEGRWV